MVEVTDILNTLLKSDKGIKAIIHATCYAHNPVHVIPGEYLVLLTSGGLFDGGMFKDEAIERFFKAAFPADQTWLEDKHVQVVCWKCGEPVRVIGNEESPWVHAGEPCGSLVTLQSIVNKSNWRRNTIQGLPS